MVREKAPAFWFRTVRTLHCGTESRGTEELELVILFAKVCLICLDPLYFSDQAASAVKFAPLKDVPTNALV